VAILERAHRWFKTAPFEFGGLITPPYERTHVISARGERSGKMTTRKAGRAGD
jgi:hypothetical protein